MSPVGAEVQWRRIVLQIVAPPVKRGATARFSAAVYGFSTPASALGSDQGVELLTDPVSSAFNVYNETGATLVSGPLPTARQAQGLYTADWAVPGNLTPVPGFYVGEVVGAMAAGGGSPFAERIRFQVVFA